MDNVLLFNNYEDLENSLKRLADTDHYTVKQVVAELIGTGKIMHLPYNMMILGLIMT